MHTVFEKPRRQRGFGLVELVVTVAILGVLMLVAIPVFGAVQKTAATNVTKAHMEQLIQAIDVARAKENKNLGAITGSYCSICAFNSVDPLTLPNDSTGGWGRYNTALDNISKASGINVRGLTDAHGRPFVIDENEGEGNPPGCGRDVLRSYVHPYNGSWENQVSLYTFKC